MTFIMLRTGLSIKYLSREWLVENIGQDGRAYITQPESQIEMVISASEQEAAYAAGQLSVISSEEKSHQLRANSSDLLGLSEKDAAAYQRQKDYLRMVEKRVGSRRTKALAKTIALVASYLDDPHPPTVSTYYRWARAHHHAASFGYLALPAPTKRGNRTDRICDAVQAVIVEFLERYYIDQQKMSIRNTWLLIVAHISTLNETLPDGKKHPLPGYKAVRSVLKSQFEDYVVCKGRLGSRAAHMRFRLAGKNPDPDYPMQRVELDHTLGNVFALDHELLALLGRPNCSVGIDAYSGMPVGFQFGYEPPSLQSLFSLMRNIILPKTYVKIRWPEISQEWECHGEPEFVVPDRGAEFVSQKFGDVCSAFGITIDLSGAKRPYQKGGVERFWGTLSEDFFHRLPGTTFSNSTRRGDYNSAQKACLAFEDIERLLHRWLIEVYANQPRHPDDNRTRRELWNEGQAKRPKIPLRPITDYGVFMSGRANPKLNGRGIRVHNEFYTSRNLELLRKANEDVKVSVRYDPADMGMVQAFDKVNEEWFIVDNVDPKRRGRSLYQLQLERRALRGEGTQAERALPGALHKLKFQQELDRTVKVAKQKVRKPSTKRPKINARAERIGIEAYSLSNSPRAENSLPTVKSKDSLRSLDIDLSEFKDET
ncbi:MAG: Mu transposase C-terminal domain-containing protein [Pseudomonadota bacterium]